MISEPVLQIEKLLKQAKSVLIVMSQNPDRDAIAAAWALYFFLEKTGNQSTVSFIDEFKGMEQLDFLPKPKNITDNIYGSQDFVLAFNIQRNKIINIRTEKDTEELRVFITPEKGSIDPRDFSFIPSKFKYDLIFVLGSPDKESIGKIYEESPDIFYEVPVVNIDYRADNENFGQINLVNLTASSVSEIIADLLDKIDAKLLDENIINCLLAGIISATDSFQRKNTTPRVLQIAARLMEKGADQQMINRHMYKTQPLHLLKLWGRIMTKLNWEEDIALIWSVLSVEDYVQSRSTPLDIPLVLDKLKDNYSAGKFFLVLYEEKPGIIAGVAKILPAGVLKKMKESLNGSVQRDILSFKTEASDVKGVLIEIFSKLRSEVV